MLNIIKKLYNISENCIFPNFCYKCLNFIEEGYLCSQCLKNINFNIYLFCPKCYRRKPIGEKLIDACCSNIIKTLITFNDYNNKPIDKLIIDGKFNGYWQIFNWFGNLISSYLNDLNILNFHLTYVPLSKKVERERGFNQTKILAKKIAKNLKLPLFEKIEKIKETEFQAKLDYQQRLKNIQNCFKAKDKPPKNLIIIDDIITTGTTLFELAKNLRESGSKNILALTICK
ncbi:MAG: phosphoribosyl transferase [Candidatus Parcubacteria bacterium]|nr:MAG: phosphoribosyl transferase [Candidatus Parcubacteria bacterium]